MDTNDLPSRRRRFADIDRTEVLILLIVVVAIVVLSAFGGSWQDSLSNLVAIFAGVFFGLRLERRLVARRGEADAWRALQMLRTELNANLEATKRIAIEKYDLEAVADALFSLRDEFWLSVSRGGSVGLIQDLQLLERISSAYESVRNLRLLADLFFKGGELVRDPNNLGFTTLFDPLRKREAERAVEQIEAAVTAINSRT